LLQLENFFLLKNQKNNKTMSQKIDASLFRRILKKYEWDSKYTKLNKEESSLLLYKDIQIKHFINKIFEDNGLLIMTCKLEYSVSRVIIKISFVNHDINAQKLFIKDIVNNNIVVIIKKYFGEINLIIKINDLTKSFENSVVRSKSNRAEHKKIMSQLKIFRNFPKQLDIIKISFIIISNKKSAKLLAKFLSYLISNQKRRHSNILSLFKKILDILVKTKISKISGLRILISGRINGFPRAKKRLLKIGSLPLQSFDASIDYYKETAYTSNGTFGIKVWVCGKIFK